MSGVRISEKNLRELLARVRERLSQAGSVDADSRQHLSALVSEIDRALGEEKRGAARTHTPRLESLAVRFEADHPGLAEVIREVIDALALAGI